MNWTGQRAYARNTDPDTSVEAADAMKDHLGEIEGQVYRLMKADAIRRAKHEKTLVVG